MPGNIGPQNLIDILAQAVIQATITGSSTPLPKAPNTGGLMTATSVGTTAVQIDTGYDPSGTPRNYALIQNNGTSPISYGFSDAVTITTGILVQPGACATFYGGPSIALYAISNTAGQPVIVQEVA